MAYVKNVPKPGSAFGYTQPIINENFNQISDIIEVDHIEFNSADQGKHAKVTLILQDPIPAINDNEAMLITSLDTNNDIQLYYNVKHGANPVTSYALTEGNTDADDGYSRLPSGFILKWGQRTVNTNNFDITFPVTIGGKSVPAFTGFPVSVQLTATRTANSSTVQTANVHSYDDTEISVQLTPDPAGEDVIVFYYAVGK